MKVIIKLLLKFIVKVLIPLGIAKALVEEISNKMGDLDLDFNFEA